MRLQLLKKMLRQRLRRIVAALTLFFLFVSNMNVAFAQTHLTSANAKAPIVDVVRVLSRRLSSTDRLPAELRPWQEVALFPKVQGFVEHIDVDRGSMVRKGEILLQLSAPELLAQTAQAEAEMIADQATYGRLLQASHTPGAVSANELELAAQAYKAAQDRVRSLKALLGYLTIRAPFSGIVTQRNVHPGALVGPPSEPLSKAVPMLRLEQIDHLRLVVPVPQTDVDLIPDGGTVNFTVSAFPGRYFTGSIARISHALDPATRTMPVEADVYQKELLLDPGMFVETFWPVRSATASLFVPASTIAGHTRPFVERVANGHVQKVWVTIGQSEGKLVEVYGELKAGDLVIAEPLPDDANGARVQPRIVGPS